mmetsp:Transcript_94327/g.262489  ORF Transcript_94327/g.262489 Transcript_94327/m.262489 type:complete len:264 (+) Transcript_94327:918-1709(+)
MFGRDLRQPSAGGPPGFCRHTVRKVCGAPAEGVRKQGQVLVHLQRGVDVHLPGQRAAREGSQRAAVDGRGGLALRCWPQRDYGPRQDRRDLQQDAGARRALRRGRALDGQQPGLAGASDEHPLGHCGGGVLRGGSARVVLRPGLWRGRRARLPAVYEDDAPVPAELHGSREGALEGAPPQALRLEPLRHRVHPLQLLGHRDGVQLVHEQRRPGAGCVSVALPGRVGLPQAAQLGREPLRPRPDHLGHGGWLERQHHLRLAGQV